MLSHSFGIDTASVVSDYYVGAGACKKSNRGRSDSTRCTGYECALAAQIDWVL